MTGDEQAARRDRHGPRSSSVIPSGGGFVVAGATAVELAWLDSLRGPALIGGSAVTESLIVALIGAGCGALVVMRARAADGMADHPGRGVG